MFELGTTDHWWDVAKKYPVLSNHPNTLKPLGYAHIITLIETFKPKRVLEVGHGAGTYIYQLYKDNIEIEFWGLDDEVKDSSVSVEDLKNVRLWNPHVKFVSGLLGSYSKELPDNYFDLVYSVSVIEHIPHEFLNSVFEDTYRILRPGGIVSHSYDIYYGQDTKAVFDAYENAKLKWLKPKSTMNVFWEKWLEKLDYESLEYLFEKVVFENPIFVAEQYMWQQERERRQSPMNFMTVLSAATKPLDGSTPENKYNDIKKVTPDNFNYFTYSKNKHFDIFSESGADAELFNKKIDPQYCDIKTYQDLLVYSFIKNNIAAGSKILEIGGDGYSRLIKKLKGEFEVWNIDKLDDEQLSKTNISEMKFINDNIGSNNKELPDNYFDFVYSISEFKYDEFNNLDKYEIVLKDINRVLKPGGFSMNCVIAMYKDPLVLLPQISFYIFENEKTCNEFIPLMKTSIDPDLFFMSEKYYSDNWQPFTGKTFKKFGKPASYNLLWKKQ